MQSNKNNSQPRRKPRKTGDWNRPKTSGFTSNFNHNRKKKPFTGAAIHFSKFINKSSEKPEVKTYQPACAFYDFKIHEKLKKSIQKRGFTYPTEIQEKTIPHILQGKDVIGLANTGTGKTGAFLVPIINKIIHNQQEKLLVVVPTRELAIQIQEEFFAFADGLNISSVVLVGGANIHPQISKLRSNPKVVIGTPGRIKDLLQRKNLNLASFNNVVLDEADRMLDMGFINDIKFLLSLVAEKRQTLFFSATLSADIEHLVQTFLKNPIKISIKTQETSALVDQDIVRVTHTEEKIEVLHNLLSKKDFEKVLIFTRTKYGADKLSKNLYQRGFKTESIHGDKNHNKRQRALKMFKENRVEILVATDVAARGLDIPNVSHVINYDIPASYEDYIHRIGRTGRANQKGIALTFID